MNQDGGRSGVMVLGYCASPHLLHLLIRDRFFRKSARLIDLVARYCAMACEHNDVSRPIPLSIGIRRHMLNLAVMKATGWRGAGWTCPAVAIV